MGEEWTTVKIRKMTEAKRQSGGNRKEEEEEKEKRERGLSVIRTLHRSFRSDSV